MQSMNHGWSWSLYVSDPEGNTIDLSQSEEVICRQMEFMAQQTPGSKTWKVWRQELQKRMTTFVA